MNGKYALSNKTRSISIDNLYLSFKRFSTETTSCFTNHIYGICKNVKIQLNEERIIITKLKGCEY